MIPHNKTVNLKKGDTVFVPLVLRYDDDGTNTSLAHFPHASYTTISIKRADIIGYLPVFSAGDRVSMRGKLLDNARGTILAINSDTAWVAWDVKPAWPQTCSLGDLQRAPEAVDPVNAAEPEPVPAPQPPPAPAPVTAPLDDGWIEWKGGDCPVPLDVVVEYKMRGDHGFAQTDAGEVRWEHKGLLGDIIAYRIAKDQPAPAADDDEVII